MSAPGGPHGSYSGALITPLTMETSSTYSSLQLLEATSESKNRLNPLLCYFRNKDTDAQVYLFLSNRTALDML